MPPRAMTDAHILVVDDQESNVQLLERLLRLKGYEQIETLTRFAAGGPTVRRHRVPTSSCSICGCHTCRGSRSSRSCIP